jgi:hypothetical protein
MACAGSQRARCGGVILLCLLSATAVQQLSAQVITGCYWEVAHPSDPDRVGPGVSSSEVDTLRAMAACRRIWRQTLTMPACNTNLRAPWFTTRIGTTPLMTRA